MEYFNSKTGLIKTKYKTSKCIDEIYCIYMYMYMACILRQLLNTFDQKLYYGNVRVSKLHPTVEKLYKLYSFWINYSHVAKLDYYLTCHIPFTKDQFKLFDNLSQLVSLIELEKYKYAKLYFNINVSELFLHEYKYDELIELSFGKFTNDAKLDFIYKIRKYLPSNVLLEPLQGQCETCKVKQVSGLTLKRNLK